MNQLPIYQVTIAIVGAAGSLVGAHVLGTIIAKSQNIDSAIKSLEKAKQDKNNLIFLQNKKTADKGNAPTVISNPYLPESVQATLSRAYVMNDERISNILSKNETVATKKEAILTILLGDLDNNLLNSDLSQEINRLKNSLTYRITAFLFTENLA